MKIAIVEDNQLYAKIIADRLIGLGFNNINIFENGEAYFISTTVFDFVLLDIELPIIDGIAISKRANPKSKIIFLTSLKDRVFEAFGCNVIGYVLKTNNIDETMNKIKSLIAENYEIKKITLRTPDGKIEVLICDIVKISKENRKIYVYTIYKVFQIYDMTLNNIQLMAKDCLVFVNRSSLVNLDNVISLNHSLLNLSNNLTEVISRNNLADVKTKLLRRLV